MKKSVLVCDICGTVIRNSDVLIDTEATVEASIPHPTKNRQFHEIDVCENDHPREYFDSGSVTLLYGGTVRAGEMFDLRGREVIAVIDQDHRGQETAAYRVSDLSDEQRQFVERAANAIEQTWKEKLDSQPHFSRNV